MFAVPRPEPCLIPNRIMPGCHFTADYMVDFCDQHLYRHLSHHDPAPHIVAIVAGTVEENCFDSCARCRHIRPRLRNPQERFRTGCTYKHRQAYLLKLMNVQDPINGAQLAGSWGTREAFVAVVTTNLPMIFPLFKRWLRPLLPKQLSSSQKVEKSPTGFRTIGGGGPGADARRKPASANALTDFTFNASDEHVGDEARKQKQDDVMFHPAGANDIEAGTTSHSHSPALDAGDAEHEEWTQLQNVSTK